jgi:hypothetical protein
MVNSVGKTADGSCQLAWLFSPVIDNVWIVMTLEIALIAIRTRFHHPRTVENFTLVDCERFDMQLRHVKERFLSGGMCDLLCYNETDARSMSLDGKRYVVKFWSGVSKEHARASNFASNVLQVALDFFRSPGARDEARQEFSELGHEFVLYIYVRCVSTVLAHPHDRYGTMPTQSTMYPTGRMWHLFHEKRETDEYGVVNGMEYLWRRVVDAFREERPLRFMFERV